MAAAYRSSISTTLSMGLIQPELPRRTAVLPGEACCAGVAARTDVGHRTTFTSNIISTSLHPFPTLSGEAKLCWGRPLWMPCKTLDKMPSPLDWDGSRGWGGPAGKVELQRRPSQGGRVNIP